MVSLSYLGRIANSLFGMPTVLTPLHPRTLPVPPAMLELELPWSKKGNFLCIATYIVPSHFFVSIAFETSGVIGPKSRLFLKELGHRIKLSTGELRSAAFLLQRLSVAVQRGNAASVLGSISLSEDL